MSDRPTLDQRDVPIEPTAETRRLARTLYATFVALTDVGFTESQAVAIVIGVVDGTAGAVTAPTDASRSS